MRHAVVAAFLLAIGCGEPEIEVTVEPIIGGTHDPGHAGVVGVNVVGTLCSGTLISRRVVLTVGRCVDPYTAEVRSVAMGPNVKNSPRAVAVDRVLRDPLYSINNPGGGDVHDVAVVHIVDDLPAQPYPLLREEMKNTPDYVGPNCTFVGYGVTTLTPRPLGDGTRLKLETPIQAVGPADVGGLVGTINDSLISYSSSGGMATCGDDGGPALLVRNGVEHVAAIIAAVGTAYCSGEGVGARTDEPEIEGFLQAAIDDLEADDPCRADGVCNDSCNTDQIVDPDCAEKHCGADGVCALACVDPPDPDCTEPPAAESGSAGGCGVAPGRSRAESALIIVLALGLRFVRRTKRR